VVNHENGPAALAALHGTEQAGGARADDNDILFEPL
jgi:hypothetical protein